MASSNLTQKIENRLMTNEFNLTEVGIGTVLKPLLDQIAFYKEVLVDHLEPAEVKEESKIKKEGAYYTYFIYECIPKSSRNLRAEVQQSSVKQSRLAIWNDINHLMINGTMTFTNSFGHLNAEQRPFLNFYPVIMLIYLLMLLFWGFMMNKYKDHLINLHWCLLAILVVSMLEAVLRWSIFLFVNNHGFNSIALVVAQVIVQVLRDTFARIITLLVSLGYGILIKTIERYFSKIFLISVLYVAALSFQLAVQHINYFTPVSGLFVLMSVAPLTSVDFVFCFWIFLALRRTLNYLMTKEQKYKFKIVSQIFGSISVCLLVIFILMLVQTMQVMSGSRDEEWGTFWVWEASWFAVFTGFVLSMVFVLRPNEMSDMLTQMQEVLDETLTEVVENETIDLDGHNELEMQEVHEFGRRGRRLEEEPEEIFAVDD